jgi:hypothetical protein
MDRWLSLSEACSELGLGGRAVKSLVRSGQLVSLRLPKKGQNRFGALRILYPGPRLRHFIQESQRHLEHVPLLNGREVAEILSVSLGAVRQLKKRGRLRGMKTGMATLYTAAEIRSFLFRRERKSRQGTRELYSPILVDWVRRLAKQDEFVDVQVLDCLLRQAIAIPESAKSQYIVAVWDHFDAINDLLRAAKLGEDVTHVARKAGTVNSVLAPQSTELSDMITSVKSNLAPGRLS